MARTIALLAEPGNLLQKADRIDAVRNECRGERIVLGGQDHGLTAPCGEVEDDEEITTAQVVEARRQVGPIGRGAGGVILEHAFAGCGIERVELGVEDLAAFGGGDAGVADEAHGVCSPENPSPPCCISR